MRMGQYRQEGQLSSTKTDRGARGEEQVLRRDHARLRLPAEILPVLRGRSNALANQLAIPVLFAIHSNSSSDSGNIPLMTAPPAPNDAAASGYGLGGKNRRGNHCKPLTFASFI